MSVHLINRPPNPDHYGPHDLVINTLSHKRWFLGPQYLYDSVIYGDKSTHRVLRAKDLSVVEERTLTINSTWQKQAMAVQDEFDRAYRGAHPRNGRSGSMPIARDISEEVAREFRRSAWRS